MASSGAPKRSWDPNKVFDVTLQEKRAIEERARMRAALKAEWQKKVSNPYRGVHGFIFDPAVQRFMSMRANHWDQFKPTPKSALTGFCLSALPIILFYFVLDYDRTKKERMFRTGQVAYKDRAWKFI